MNTYTIGYQTQPGVAADADGDFVVVWHSGWVYNQDGSKERRFRSDLLGDGRPQASEFQVNSYTTSRQSGPAVAVEADGDFVVAWESSARTVRATACSPSASRALALPG